MKKPFKTPPITIEHCRPQTKTTKATVEKAADKLDCENILKGLDAKRIPVEDKVKHWLDTNMVDKEQELNRQATDDHKDCFNKEEIGSDHAQQSHSDEHPLLELTSTMDAGNIVPLQNLKTVFLVGKEKRKRSPSSPCTADHTPRLSKRANSTQERTEKSMQEGERYLEGGLERGEDSGEKSGSDKEREDQTNAGKIAVNKAQRIGGGLMQKDKQQETLKQLQDQLTEEQRQTENLAKQREELVSRQGQLQSQLQKERTQNERMKEKYLILRQQVEEMSKHKTAFKCLGCDAINAHVTVTSRNALQLLSRDSGTCRYHRHLTEFVRKRMPLITVTHSPEAIRRPSFSQLPREQLHPSHGDQEQQPPLQQEDQQVLAQEQQTLQDQDELSTNPSSSSCQDEQSLSSKQEQHSPQPSLNQEEQNPIIHVLSSSSQEELEELSLIQPSPLHSQSHRHQPLLQQQQRSSLYLPHQTMTQQHKTLHQHESHHEPKQNQSMIKQHHQPKQLLHNQTLLEHKRRQQQESHQPLKHHQKAYHHMQRQQRCHQQDQEYSVLSSSSDHSDHELTVPTHSTHCGTSRQKRQPLSDIKNTQSSSRDRTPCI